jgi:hypothetical protein
MKKESKVRLVNVRHKQFDGVAGVIVKIIKKRNEVVVKCENGKNYYASPENIEFI